MDVVFPVLAGNDSPDWRGPQAKTVAGATENEFTHLVRLRFFHVPARLSVTQSVGVVRYFLVLSTTRPG